MKMGFRSCPEWAKQLESQWFQPLGRVYLFTCRELYFDLHAVPNRLKSQRHRIRTVTLPQRSLGMT
jgi:hypothetical protein